MASLQYNPPQSPTPLDVHLPEDEELLTYLEEFSPCGPDGCELPGANSTHTLRSWSKPLRPCPATGPCDLHPKPPTPETHCEPSSTRPSSTKHDSQPSLDYGPNHHAAARAAAMAAGDPYHYQSGYGNPGMDRNQNTSAPGSHYSRSSNRDSISQNSVLHHAMTNNSGRSSPYIGQQRSASARTTSTTGSTLSGDPTACLHPRTPLTACTITTNNNNSNNNTMTLSVPNTTTTVTNNTNNNNNTKWPRSP
ncbi:hypothetical protein BC829DRAFT_284068 [Chytridium lagenaria]|nr:hypothetical protein BC829DRAFT_284068 [Chytridium lagenaria]